MIPSNRDSLHFALGRHIAACEQIRHDIKRQIIAGEMIDNITEAQDGGMISGLLMGEYVASDTEVRRILQSTTPTTAEPQESQ
jgi:hypothetical protein